MITIKSLNSSYLPEISSAGLLDLPVQETIIIPSGGTVSITLGYGIGLSQHLILDFVICGELRRSGLVLTENRHLHTSLHNPLEPIGVSITNQSSQDISIAESSHAFHAIIINSSASISYD